jgi:hypothetical protein
MSRNPMSKLLAGLLVLVMALGTLVVLPGPNQGQTPGTNDIVVPVFSGGIPVSGATVTLTNVHTGEVLPTISTGGMYRAAAAPSGYYRVDVSAVGYYSAVNARQFAFLGTASLILSPIQLVQYGLGSYQLNITVRTAASPHNTVAGAHVSFYDDAVRQKVAEATTTGVGLAQITMFETSSPTMYLTVEANRFETNATSVIVSSTSEKNITVWLDAGTVISGVVTNSDGSQAGANTVAYALDMNTGLPWVKRLLKSSTPDSSFFLNAKSGDTYLICIDADGLAANVSQATVSGAVWDMGSVHLNSQTMRTEQVDMAFASNFASFSYSMATELSYDEAVPGLNYSDIGSLRMQIDLNWYDGAPNGDLSSIEVSSFIGKMHDIGVAHPTSGRLLTVNSTLYQAAAPTFGTMTGLAAGSVISLTGVSYSYTTTYSVVAGSSVEANAPLYDMNATVMLDTPEVHHITGIDIPSIYEAVQNTTGGHVNVTGYNTLLPITLSSETGPTVLEKVYMKIEKSEKPSVKGGIDTTLAGVYAVYDDLNLTKYIVKVGMNVNFTSGSSSDPNGNPLTYTWDFTDGTTVTTRNVTVGHNFTTPSVMRHVVLNVSDVAGLWNATELNVTCDGLPPTPVITFLNKTVNTTDNSISVDQHEGFVLNATASTDDVAGVGDEAGIIDHVEFDYGDGNTSGRIPWLADQQNTSHSYADAGDFNLTLNVTDVVGHWRNTTIVVHVNDTTKPTISYTVKNATGGTSLVENKTIVFDANLTTDNHDNLTQLYFSWYFGDGTWMNGTGAEGLINVTHNYTRIGAVTVSLNVTDLNGNYLQAPKMIQIASGPRPIVRIDRVYYDPGNFTESQSGYIIVNMTNTGSATANNVVLSLYVINSDGSEKLLTTWSNLLNGTSTVTVIDVGGTVQAKIPWSFGSKGTYTLKLNVTSENQLVPGHYTASGDQALHVNAAGWKKIALWGGVAAVIILVPLAIYLSRKWSKREKKGPRREKKSEKDKSKGEDL